MAGLCQDCDMCCRILAVEEIKKPWYKPCQHLAGGGCGIYSTRPLPCQSYRCVWLESQSNPRFQAMPESLRPNVCHVVMGQPNTVDTDTLFIYPSADDPHAWRVPPVSVYLQNILSRGAKVVVVIGKNRIVINGQTNMAVMGTEEEFEQLLA